jgi:peptide/nickel transport system substrate-binding protein
VHRDVKPENVFLTEDGPWGDHARLIDLGVLALASDDPEKAHEIINAGWGPDWPNASTIIPELFTPAGGFNLSQYDNAEFIAASDAAKIEPDRAKQAKMWQDLNAKAMADVAVVPTRFGRTQRITGTKIGPAYLWPAYGSWPYGDMYAVK